MSLLEMLQKRHSIRKYTDANISDQDLQTILQAGLLSASGRAARPWEFIVVRNKEAVSVLPKCLPMLTPQSSLLLTKVRLMYG